MNNAVELYLRQTHCQLADEKAKKDPNKHLISVLEMHINMAKDFEYTKKYGLVTDDAHGEFARAYLLGYY